MAALRLRNEVVLADADAQGLGCRMSIDYGALAKELSTFVRGAVVHHAYVGDKEQTWLMTIHAALQEAHKYRWRHIDDELPPIDEWVLCAGYMQRENGEVYAWSGCGKRRAKNASTART